MHYFYTFLKLIKNFNFDSAKILLYIHNKSFRRIFEAATIP